jgi:hypothetical protein
MSWPFRYSFICGFNWRSERCYDQDYGRDGARQFQRRVFADDSTPFVCHRDENESILRALPILHNI